MSGKGSHGVYIPTKNFGRDGDSFIDIPVKVGGHVIVW